MESVWKGLIALVSAAVAAYFRVLMAPLLVLIVVMILDYISGISAAWEKRELSSRVGIVGIVKKVCYLLIVAVGIVIDYLISMLGSQFGVVVVNVHFVGLLVIIWLIVNELISILENTDEMGLPVPPFVKAILARLKKHTEEIPEAVNDPEIE